MIANILSIAGSDPSGGAGIQADLKSISANGAYGMAVITGLTAQNTQGVSAIDLVSPEMVGDQIAMIRNDIRIDAIKIGMLGNAGIAGAVANGIDGLDVPVVLDTVMVAKGGDRLLQADAVDALRNLLLPRATVITPNMPEAADLLEVAEASDEGEIEDQAQALIDLGAQAVLLKGGHMSGAQSSDLLAWGENALWIDGPRFDTPNTHGTGCTLSSALAARLGQGEPLDFAARVAKEYVTGAIAASGELSVGEGFGPTHHFHDLWLG